MSGTQIEVKVHNGELYYKTIKQLATVTKTMTTHKKKVQQAQRIINQLILDSQDRQMIILNELSSLADQQMESLDMAKQIRVNELLSLLNSGCYTLDEQLQWAQQQKIIEDANAEYARLQPTYDETVKMLAGIKTIDVSTATFDLS